MSGGASYSLSDFLLFSPATYFRLFELHNAHWWPAQILALATGIAILLLARRGGAWPGRMAALLLAACWLWVAWAFLLERYATINWSARYFAWAFTAQAILLLWTAACGRLQFASPPDAGSNAAGGVILLALAGWPLLARLDGRSWGEVGVFGFAPDPTAVATLGVLLAAARMRWELLPIPLLWCVVSGATLWTLGAAER